MCNFRGLVLTPYGRSGLSQCRLAELLVPSRRAIQAWKRRVFASGRVVEEALALRGTALSDAPRFDVPSNDAWFPVPLSGKRPAPLFTPPRSQNTVCS
jgi:hypothetical protein